MPPARAKPNSLRNPANLHEPKPDLFPKKDQVLQLGKRPAKDSVDELIRQNLDIEDMYPAKKLGVPPALTSDFIASIKG